MPEKTINNLALRLILRSVYLKGHQDGNLKTTDISWEDRIISDIRQLIKKELEEKLPKEQDVLEHHEKYHLNCHRCIEILTHNQALTDCKTAIAEYLGEGEK